uniref:Uncharacterized protein n=1 Tax=Arion vulgaris TaxID=1028688 RepID=A0A0B7BA42_9EUPU
MSTFINQHGTATFSRWRYCEGDQCNYGHARSAIKILQTENKLKLFAIFRLRKDAGAG